MNKAVNLIKRLILFFIGMSIIQFGVALFLKTNIGSDPFTVFTQGLAGTAQVSPGAANRMILVVLFVVILLVERKRINIGTLLCVFAVGPMIDIAVKVFSYLPVESYNYFIRMLLVAVGCFIIAVGFAILSATNIGVAPNDIVPFIIQDKTKIEYRWIRIGIDATFLVSGFILGGTVGIGTVISMLSTGPFIQFCLPYGQKFVNFIVNGKISLNEESTITA